MMVIYHPEFPNDLRKFRTDYAEVSAGLAARFEKEVDRGIEAISAAPSAAGHFLNTGSVIIPELRRRNLRSFPFFILYGVLDEKIMFGSIVPSRSDPLTWLARFRKRA
jgi:hypothetical protein